MKIYNFDPASGRFLSEGQADPDPMTPGEFLLPAFSTPKAPPKLAAGQVAMFDRVADKWLTLSLPPAPPVTPSPAPAVSIADEARTARNRALSATDWRVTRHRDQLDAGTAPTLAPDEYAALLAFRQALRDVPQQETFPDTINWPEAPAV